MHANNVTPYGHVNQSQTVFKQKYKNFIKYIIVFFFSIFSIIAIENIVREHNKCDLITYYSSKTPMTQKDNLQCDFYLYGLTYFPYTLIIVLAMYIELYDWDDLIDNNDGNYFMCVFRTLGDTLYLLLRYVLLGLSIIILLIRIVLYIYMIIHFHRCKNCDHNNFTLTIIPYTLEIPINFLIFSIIIVRMMFCCFC